MFAREVFVVVLAVATVTSVSLAVVAWEYRNRESGRWFIGSMLGMAAWSGGQIGSTLATDPGLSLLFVRLIFLGAVTVPGCFTLFVLSYSEYDTYVDRRTVAALSVHPVVTTLVIWTNGWHGLFWRSVTPDSATTTGLAFVRGPVLWLHIGYSYLLLLGAVLVLGLTVYRKRSVYGVHAFVALCALLVPWLLNALFFAGVLERDYTSAAHVFSTAVLWIAVVRYDFMDVVPVAWRSVIDTIDDGVLVLDERDRIVDVNEKAKAMLGIDSGEAIGRDAESVLSAYPDLYERYDDVDSTTDRIAVDVGDQVNHFEVRLRPMETDRGETIGRVVVVRDVTAEEERQRALERQNERLDQFAGVVSHDLRNPLNVASGYVELIEEEADAEIASYATEIERSHERMERLIEDVLALARQGRVATETERVELAAVARRAWRNVATGDAALDLATDRTVEADETRLLQLFENLFRNAVEHGGEDVTVRVGRLGTGGVTVRGFDDDVDPDHGFFVEDDGPGIPADRRERVLEPGVTSDADGTGLGLSIVRSIAEAHGWSVRVTESASGGARFEIRTGTLPANDSGAGAITATDGP